MLLQEYFQLYPWLAPYFLWTVCHRSLHSSLNGEWVRGHSTCVQGGSRCRGGRYMCVCRKPGLDNGYLTLTFFKTKLLIERGGCLFGQGNWPACSSHLCLPSPGIPCVWHLCLSFVRWFWGFNLRRHAVRQTLCWVSHVLRSHMRVLPVKQNKT